MQDLKLINNCEDPLFSIVARVSSSIHLFWSSSLPSLDSAKSRKSGSMRSFIALRLAGRSGKSVHSFPLNLERLDV